MTRYAPSIPGGFGEATHPVKVATELVEEQGRTEITLP